MTNPDPIRPFEADHDLAWRIDIINSMVIENPEYTIKDYLDLVEDVKRIHPIDE